jgi:signal transduction histidine kinase/ligand-binding sensor domain-containing protein
MLATVIVRWIALGVTTLGLLASPSIALALDPALDASRYGHAVWRDLNASGLASIGPMAQTSDGYLWLGTPSGLLRFDGVRGVAWRAPAGSELPDERVRTLLAARDGTLWIGTLGGIASWKDGRLVAYPVLVGDTINALEEDADGTVWVGGSHDSRGPAARKALLCSVRKGEVKCSDPALLPGGAVVALARDTTGALWAAAANRVWKLGARPEVSFDLPHVIRGLRAMAATPDGGLVIVTRQDVIRIADGHMETLPLPEWTRELRFLSVLCDRDGGLWVAAIDYGLLHLHAGRVEAYRTRDGLSDDHVLGLFEDREGNVWASTPHGLDRFRPMAAAIYSRADGLRGRGSSVLVARDGSVFASTTSTLYHLQDDKVTEVAALPASSLFEDSRGRVWLGSLNGLQYLDAGRFVTLPVPTGGIDGMAETSDGSVWIAHRSAGLYRFQPDSTLERVAWPSFPEPSAPSTMVVDPADDALWLGFWSGAVIKVSNGEARMVLRLRDAGRPALGSARVDAEPPSRASAAVLQLRIARDGTLWVVSRKALIRVKNGHATRFDSDSGLPCDGAYSTLEDEQTFWIYAQCGLIGVDRTEMDAWRAAADAGATHKVKVRLLDSWDGIGQPSNVTAVSALVQGEVLTPKAARTPDGRIWMIMADGIAAVDPKRIPVNSVVPPVHVEQIVADGAVHGADVGLRLGPRPRDLEIQYTALSFTVPEQVRFRYKLEGRDADWQDAGTRRQAFYTDLPPGRYRFRVIAANNSGLWNEQGDTVEFSIEPAWWQTNAFRVACAAAAALLLYGLYRLRVARLTRQFRMALDARVEERLRIARELHDTLLQSFQGLVLRLQTALQLWPTAEARNVLADSIDQASGAVTEARDAVQDLRAAATDTNDLADAIRALGETQATAERHVAFRVDVEGKPRALHPLVRDDVFRIAGETLGNAFRHADPKHVEVELHYDERELRLRIRDDGRGIDAGVVDRGREGHFGLRGMRERAKGIGATLSVWSRPGAGTEVELGVPATRAYAPGGGAPTHDPEAIADAAVVGER